MTRFGRDDTKKTADKTVLDLGMRKVSSQNFSKIVTLPKHFLKSSPFGEFNMVKMTMLEDGSLKLTPVRQNGDPDEFSVF